MAIRSLVPFLKVSSHRAVFAVCVWFATAHAFAATLSWSGGGGANANWNNSANWGFAGTPVSGDTLVFPGGQPNLANTNNLVGLVLSQIRFAGGSGGYSIRGNAFTITNSIAATNTAGVNAISNNITLGTADVTVEVTTTLSLAGALSGSVGLTKTGVGTLHMEGASGNSYSGTTTVNVGTLELNKSSGDAIVGPLVIGDGTGTDVVRSLTDTVIGVVPIRLNGSGLLDLNGFSDTIGSLTFNGGDVTTGAGEIWVSGNLTNLATGSTISGTLSLNGAVRTLHMQANGLVISATIKDGSASGAGILQTGVGQWTMSASNSYSGPTIVNGFLILQNDFALGTSGGATNGTIATNAASFVLAQIVDVGNEFLTLGDGADFRSSGAASWAGPITLNGDVDINVFGGTFTLSGVISGAGGFTKGQSGTLVLSGSAANAFGGAVAVHQGQLHLNKSFGTAIPPSADSLTIGDGIGGASADVVRELSFSSIHNLVPIIINGSGQLDLNNFDDEVGIGGITMNGGNIITGTGVLFLDGDVTVTDSTNAASISGVVNLTGTRTFNIADDPSFTPDLTVGATVIGIGGIIKTGDGMLGLSVSNSFIGTVTINDGVIRANDNFSLGTVVGGVVVNGDAGLQLSSAHVGAEALTLNSSSASALQAISGSNSWSGPITLSATAGIAPNSGTDTLNLSGVIAGAGGVNKNSLGTLYYSGAGANIYAGVTTVNAGTLVLAKSIGNGAMTSNLTIGDGVGGVNADVVRTAGASQLPNSVAVTVNSSGLIEFNVFDDFGSLAGAGNVTLNAGVGVGHNNSTTVFSGVASGTGSFNKYGTGMMTLSGANTHTGATTANEGILRINGFQPQSPVSVGADGTLNGFGTVGNLNNGGGGVVAPGTSAGRLTCSNATFALVSSDYTVEIFGTSPGGNYDQLDARGTVNLGGSTLNVTAAGYLGFEGQNFIIVSNDAADAVVGTFNGLAEGAIITSGLFKFRLSYVGGSGNDVMLTLTNPPFGSAGASVIAGNGNTTLDPNECNLIYLVITNGSATAISNIFAQISTTNDHVILHQAFSDYPTIPANGTGTNLIAFQLSTLPGFVCGSSIRLQLTFFSSGGGNGVSFNLPSGHPGTTLQFTNSTFLGIPDVTFVNSTNVVSGISNSVAKVTVSVYLTHPNDGDLALRLIGPDGQLVVLSDFNGATGDDYGSDCAPGSYTVFDDAAGTSITAGSPPYVGTFKPEGSLASYIGKTGADVNGNWVLQIEDDVGGGPAGTLRCWVLNITQTECAPGDSICDTCPGFVAGSFTGGDPTNPDRISRHGTGGQCGAPQPCDGAYNMTGPYRYDVHVFTNSSAFSRCYRVYLDTTCEDAISASAYVGSYQPTNVCENFLAEMGSIPSKTFDSFSFIVPGATNFLVVVNEVFGGSGCDYTFVVTGDQCPPPVLNITPSSPSSVKLDWTTAAAGYNLERTNTLVTGVFNWPAVTNNPVVVSGRFTVTNSVSGTTNNFYRLKQRLFD